MRKDVNKVLTECYKEGSKRVTHFPRRTIDKLFDETGGKIGMRQVHVKTVGHETKSFGENLAYLPRFLAANVGRKWDDIYSEISANLDRRSATQEHIFQHLFDYFVPAHEVVFVGNRPHRVSNSYTFPICASDYRGLYVDPRSGILKEGMKNKHGAESYQEAKARERKAREFAQKRILSPTLELFKLEDDLWYAFELKKVPPAYISYEFAERFPTGFDEQQAWSRRKTEFDDLPKSEKMVVGKRVVHSRRMTDAERKVPYGYRSPLTEDKTVRVKGGKHYERKTIPATHYYASMRSASKKELRAAGL